MPKQFLNPPGLGAVAGPFSQGVRVGNTIWVSAQAGQDADGNVIGLNDPEAQCRALFERIRAVLAAGGAAPTDIVMVRGFLRHRDCLQATWKVRKEFFGGHRPASTTFMVSDVEPAGALMSFEVVATLDQCTRMAKEFYNPPDVFSPVNIYSHGVRCGNTITFAGQAPLADDGNVVGPGNPLAQCERVFADLKKTLDLAGVTFADIVYVRAYVTDKTVLPVLRDVAAGIFGANRPAFAPVIVPSVRAAGALVEIELVAELG